MPSSFQRPFASGLSYTSFSYKWSASAAAARTATTVDYAAGMYADVPLHSVVVTNTGTQYAGDCVVTAFVLATPGSPDDLPLKKMFGFQRLKAMAPGESRMVTFYPEPSALSVIDADGKRVLKPGEFSIEVGDIVTPARKQLRLTGDAVVLEANEWAKKALLQN